MSFFQASRVRQRTCNSWFSLIPNKGELASSCPIRVGLDQESKNTWLDSFCLTGMSLHKACRLHHVFTQIFRGWTLLNKVYNCSFVVLRHQYGWVFSNHSEQLRFQEKQKCFGLLWMAWEVLRIPTGH